MAKGTKKLLLLSFLAVISILAFLLTGLNFEHFSFGFSYRFPKVLAMIVAAFCLGAGTLIFQTITNNRVLTPCILGLTPLYIVVQTFIVFALGASNVFTVNRSYNFILSLVIMSICSILVYRLLFDKNKGNILFVLLIGTVMGQFFGSLSSFMQRIIDPNDFLVLQNKLFASFKSVNTDILILSFLLILALFFYCRKELRYLDIISLGRDQAVNLGIPYDKSIRKLMMVVTLLVGIATALVGPITFLGFIVTNIARELMKTYKHSYLIASTALIAIITLAAGQTLVEHVFSYTTTLSVLINLIGGVYFIATLLLQSKNQ